jgi:hypothetical protein
MTEHKYDRKVSVEFRIKYISRGIYRGKPFTIGLTNQLHENPRVAQLAIKFVTVSRI